jgi:polysaccharide deacetylase family protein (PEP-CTERM system associated)
MKPATVLSFDIEEHYRIEAAVDRPCPADRRADYARRMTRSTHRLLETLAEFDAPATFFVVGDIARSQPKLVRAIHAAGHEVASHSWEHHRVHRFTPKSFRQDLLRSKRALEDVTGSPVRGFRAPTFSIVRQTAWALDVLRGCGFEYDSSIFPIRHDRYGIWDAPRTPFRAVTRYGEMLELPPLTLRAGGINLPVAGGGYFRLFPPPLVRAGIRQALRLRPGVAMLYFHPWEFDPDQPRLPLGLLSRFRTYVGIRGSQARLRSLLKGGGFRRAIDVVGELKQQELPRFSVEPAPAEARGSLRGTDSVSFEPSVPSGVIPIPALQRISA